MVIGSYIDGRILDYDEELYQFSIGGTLVSLPDVRAYDAAGQITWGMPEQREWLRTLDDAAFIEAHNRAMVRRYAIGQGGGAGRQPQPPRQVSKVLVVVIIAIIVVLIAAIVSCAVTLGAQMTGGGNTLRNGSGAMVMLWMAPFA